MILKIKLERKPQLKIFAAYCTEEESISIMQHMKDSLSLKTNQEKMISQIGSLNYQKCCKVMLSPMTEGSANGIQAFDNRSQKLESGSWGVD